MTRALEVRRRPAASILGSLAALARVRSCAAGALLGLLGAALAGDPAAGCLAAVSLACAIGFAQVANDIADAQVDRIGKPHRPLPSGAVSMATAKTTAWCCAAGCLLTAAAHAATLAFAAALLALSWLYSMRLKSTVLAGNILVAALASSTVPFGAVAGGHVPPRVFAVQGVVLTFSLTFEIVKTAIDALGDAAAGIRTVATRLGVPVAARLAAVAALAFVATTPWPAWHHDHPLPYLLAMTAGGVVPALFAAGHLTLRGRTVAELEVPYRLLRVAWVAGSLSLTLVLL